MKTFLAAIACLAATTALAAWEPPPNPNPRLILRQMEQDRANGRYEDALAKQLWFRAQGARLDPGLTGVRNSFALSDWARLGTRYPPALAKLREVRDQAEADVRAGGSTADAFIDFAAINRALDEEQRTVDLFAWLADEDTAAAERVAEYARDPLVEAKRYDLAARYLKPEASLASAAETYRWIVNDQRADARLREFAVKKYTNQVAIAVGLLAANGRQEEARKIADLSLAVMSSEAFSDAVARALKGEVPAPYPGRELRAQQRALDLMQP